jgi:hypothetical protein
MFCILFLSELIMQSLKNDLNFSQLEAKGGVQRQRQRKLKDKIKICFSLILHALHFLSTRFKIVCSHILQNFFLDKYVLNRRKETDRQTERHYLITSGQKNSQKVESESKNISGENCR